MMIERLGKDTYQTVGDFWDCHIRFEGNVVGGGWYVDVFEKRKRNADKAHVTTEFFRTLNEALDFAAEWE